MNKQNHITTNLQFQNADLPNTNPVLTRKNLFFGKLQELPLTEKDKSKIMHAVETMIYYHQDQEPRDDGLPYACHPIEVAGNVIDIFLSSDFKNINAEVMIAALFHDSLEDQAKKIIGITGQTELNEEQIQDLARKQIEKDWGKKVAAIITQLTNPDFTTIATLLQKKGDLRDLQVIKHELYHNHVIDLINYPETLAVKISDLKTNALTVFALPESAQKTKLISKYTPVVLSLLDKSTDPNTCDESKAVINAVLEELGRYKKMAFLLLN